MRKLLYVSLVFALLVGTGAAVFARGDDEVEQVNSVEVLHWWTSGGEAAALNVLKEDLEAKGIEWIDMPVAGGGGTEAMTVLRSQLPPAMLRQQFRCSVLTFVTGPSRACLPT